MDRSRSRFAVVVAVRTLLIATLASCGGGLSGPDGEGVVLRGTVQGAFAVRAFHAGTDPQPPRGVCEPVGVGVGVVGGAPPDTVSVSPNT